MESTRLKYCPIWSHIESIAGNQGIYETKCGPECARYSETYDTCIDIALSNSQITKNNSKYR